MSTQPKPTTMYDLDKASESPQGSQPKPTDEWTLVARSLHFNVMCGIKVIYEGVTSESRGQALCATHNAALAEANDMWDRASRQADTLAEYLVDAKGDLSVAIDALKQISDRKRHGESAWRIAKAALEKVKEGK